jgi:PmbA protein
VRVSDEHELLGHAERLVVQALNRRVPEAEVYLERGVSMEVSLEKGSIATASSSRSMGGAWRIVRDGRLGFSYFTRLEDALKALDQAVLQSRHAPRKGFHLPAAGKPTALRGRWDDRVAALDVERAMALAVDLMHGAKEGAPKAVLSGGGVGFDASWVAIASTQGIACADRSTSAGAAASLVQEDGERSVSGSESVTRHDARLDAHAVAVQAAETLVSLLGPKPVKQGGRSDVVFRPDAVAELVTGLVVSAATGDEARRGKTVWSDRLGEVVADARLRITDDSAAPGAVGGVPFDDEGLPTTRLPILEGGVLRNFIYDSWDAHEHGAISTRSGVRGDFKSRVETGTHHLVVDGSKTESRERLVAGVDDGFLVESVLGAHTANVTTGDFSVTSPNVWRIRKGELAGPVSGIAIAGNLPDLLRHLDGVSSEAKQMDGARIPHLRFRGVDISV